MKLPQLPRTKLLLVLFIATVATAHGFSPYENYLLSGKPTRVGLVAAVAQDKLDDVAASLERLKSDSAQAALGRAGISDVSAYRRQIGGEDWVVVTFGYAGGRDYLGAAAAFENATPEAAALSELTVRHPLAEIHGNHWLQMEWINYIRGKDVPGPAASQLMIVTTIRPEKEAEYRSLHQTVWPGVVDELIRANNRNLAIFLAQIDGKLVEFLYLEYVGSDPKGDEARSQGSAVNRRWWTLTDACQQPLPGVDGIWDLMQPIPE